MRDDEPGGPSFTRRNIYATAQAFEAALDLHEIDAAVPGDVRRLISEYERGVIMVRDRLDLRSRFIVWLSAACVRGATHRLRGLTHQAVQSGLSRVEISELFLQCAIYAGFTKVESAFREAGLGEFALPADDIDADLAAISIDLRTQLHGDRGSSGYSDPDRAHMGELYDLAAEYGYGAIWSRPGLDLRGRLICALAAMTCEPRATQSLRKFAETLLDHGVAEAELSEIVIQTVPFIGFPAAFAAMNVVCDAIDARGVGVRAAE
ncbi:MAG: carboxymuconolactone decarboxylase family protein [Paracoccaceae bacterium]|nr:carboxymuconolactone decarboxylase family protein [Paracoccaceae bacterium]